MVNILKGKHVVLGATGSIASYKAADLTSKLVQSGALVDVVLTENAERFLSPLTFRSLTHRPVFTSLFETESELSINHVALAERADVVLIAPATANTMAAMAAGLAGDPLTATVLATKAPVVVAPAMDGNMWQAEATQANAKTLRDRGMTLVGPEEGRLASGLTGAGRMTEPAALLDHLRQVLGRNGDLAGRKVVVSAGGTSEPVDPVRVITNRSSGKMGRALAEAARDRGARVVLVTAADMPLLAGAEVLRVDTVASMRSAVLSACEGADAVIMAAAVSDYRPAEVSPQKIKKTDGEGRLTLELVKNDDFMLEIPEGVLRIGFAAESENVLENARAKVRKKGLELIAANDITEEGSGFGVDTNRVTILDRHGNAECLPLMSKFDAAHRILDRIAKLLSKTRRRPARIGPPCISS